MPEVNLPLLPSSPSGLFLKDDGTWAAAGGSFAGDMDDIPNGTTYVKTENNVTDAMISSWDSKEDGGAAASALSLANDYTDSQISTLDSAKLDVPTGTPDGTKYLRDDNTWQPVSGGSDPWTNVILGSDFVTSLTANTAVTGLNFTPEASKRYLVEVSLLLRTATATVGARPGFSWPTGLDDGGAWLQAPNSLTANAFRNWGAKTTQNAASTGLADTTSSHLAIGGAYFITGVSPSGNFQVTLATETAATNVTMKAGSLLRYREIT